MPIEVSKIVNVEYMSVEVEYIDWVIKTIRELKDQNAMLLEALKSLLEVCYGIPHGQSLAPQEKIVIDREIEFARQAIAKCAVCREGLSNGK